MSEGSRRLHQLCESIHIEESNQLIDEDRQSRYLRLTDLNDFDIKCCLGQSTTSRTGRYGCNSIIYRVEKANAPGGLDTLWCLAITCIIDSLFACFSELCDEGHAQSIRCE